MAVEAYVSQQKNRLLDSLENQVRFSQLIAVVTGDKGIGKSFLVKQLQKRIENDVLVASIDASLAMTKEQLEQSISLQLGLSWQDTPTNLELRIQKDLSQKVLIIVDDAHLLSTSCLDYLLLLNQNQLSLQESVLFILLAGDITLPSMISELKTFEEHQDMCVVFQINPIRQHETQAMLADFPHDNILLAEDLADEKKLNYFWQLSKGNPAELYYHLNRWFEENSPTEIIEVSRDEKTSYLKSAMYVFIAVILLTALIFQDSINSWIDTGDKPQVENKNNVVNEGVLNSGNADKKKFKEKKETTLINNTNTSEVAPKESAAESTDEVDEKSITETLEDPVEQQSDDLKSDPLPIENETEAEELTTQTKIEQVEKKNPLPKEIKPEDNGSPGSRIKSTLTKEETNLLLQDTNLFVLQWVGVSQLSAANAYVNNHALAHKMIIYRRSSGNKLLYLVISGQFLSRLQADVAKAEYKKRGYQGEPWVKSMQAVQSEIQAFQKIAR